MRSAAIVAQDITHRMHPIQATGDSATKHIADLVYAASGLTLHAGNNSLIASSIKRRTEALGIGTAEDYLAYLRFAGSDSELAILLELLSSNLTMFFRDEEQLKFLVDACLPRLLRDNPHLKVWSAACSSGEEPYSLGMLFSEFRDPRGELDWQILASDRSEKMIAQARRGIYPAQRLSRMPETMREKYFEALTGDAGFKVNSQIRERIEFNCGNLFDEHEFDGPFQIIVCRNILIYCDWHVQQSLVRHLAKFLAPGGWLLVGDCENLNGLATPFRRIGPRTYEKTGETRPAVHQP